MKNEKNKKKWSKIIKFKVMIKIRIGLKEKLIIFNIK